MNCQSKEEKGLAWLLSDKTDLETDNPDSKL